jgi:dTDP-L-rhamnose 4-epimerase
MTKKVLITGGAGFIGSHLADELLGHGYRVRALDALLPQVHGAERRRPSYLDQGVELVIGDVRNPEDVKRALAGVDVVYHLAARVGVGQSMYEISRYTDTNNLGTAVLLETLARSPIERLIVASSMSVYGEGLYSDERGRRVENASRSLERLRRGVWEPTGDSGEALTPVATPETKPVNLASVYALSKYDQEQLCLTVGRAYNVPTVALRFFNVYGPRQALSNPYTGVLAIFASRLLNRARPLIFEDGGQRRDFVSVRDVARACRLALERPNAAGHVLNIGSGHSHSVLEIARQMAEVMGAVAIAPEVTAQYRVGDIRHCFADIALARHVLGYEPEIALSTGLRELASWLEGQVAHDSVEQAKAELSARGLTL